MLNFGGFLTSNFWNNYRCQTSPTIEELLNNKECTVEKLLDDEDCLQEFKNYNDKLIKYFDHDKLKILIGFYQCIVAMPLVFVVGLLSAFSWWKTTCPISVEWFFAFYFSMISFRGPSSTLKICARCR